MSLPGIGLIGGNASVGILLSRMSVDVKIVVCGGLGGGVRDGLRGGVVVG